MGDVGDDDDVVAQRSEPPAEGDERANVTLGADREDANPHETVLESQLSNGDAGSLPLRGKVP